MNKRICEQVASDSCLTKRELDRLSLVSRKASEIGGGILMKYYRKIDSINSKSVQGDLVTNADIEAEKEVISFLNSETPEIGIFAEESGISGPNTDYIWYIDPLDGTTNYAHGYPFFACSIGLAWKGRPLLGSIRIPFFNETYWACPGLGSFCNNESLSVSSVKTLNESLLVTGFAYDRKTTPDNNYAEFCWLTNKSHGVRRGGSAALDLAFIAAGRLDGYWERGLSPWDIAAGVPIVELAGGIVSDYKNSTFNLKTGRILACNPYIQQELVFELSKVKPLEAKSFGG
ncbi:MULTISPECIES: inositol monophosphatase family protein [unclassified Prochlorococcus]|uniref:inositol monophosphatase family protein n=1 Tax=unclassified Prochlorococcus TaxID=2627481 RepID=UPI000533A9DB|nr:MULTISPECIES: inositol monophosphatase family protein [unclassified Prochlorococcus]KGG15257.1 Inositol-1-monophosphatasee [Prochlorococcus sp. MIT 0602]KGG17534.1 Inositol-1-monophosphatasee [Prochlorococcus sp. MIT 0603]